MSYRDEAKEREASRIINYVQTDIPATSTFTVADVPPEREPKDITCEKCGKRPGFAWWTEGSIAFAHGMKWAWCEQCCVDAQLAHAYMVTATIPALEKRLRELLAENAE